MGSTSYLLRCVRSFSQTLEEAALADADLLRRFVRNQDSAAFSALLARHGPMVLGVCQRTLQSPAEMEDAFQATFLVLIRARPQPFGNPTGLVPGSMAWPCGSRESSVRKPGSVWRLFPK